MAVAKRAGNVGQAIAFCGLPFSRRRQKTIVCATLCGKESLWAYAGR